ncbi:hypothetical protein BUALT_Bualt02G0217100 [Buddleja alternifolia]|uniref:Uncharacterized protein n=1 Tax=Buddleja alternifolia TaxID=168488 RepID=A0AAV6YCZ7_9LAMI|nr:hypothetical protein BUALT_Bualt02G0217100 [Buddleja alternifolia]
MRKMSGKLVSSKRISLSRSAILKSHFASVENGSSPTVSMYLQRTAGAFNHLADFHDKVRKTYKVQGDDGLEQSPDLDSTADIIHVPKEL